MKGEQYWINIFVTEIQKNLQKYNVNILSHSQIYKPRLRNLVPVRVTKRDNSILFYFVNHVKPALHNFPLLFSSFISSLPLLPQTPGHASPIDWIVTTFLLKIVAHMRFNVRFVQLVLPLLKVRFRPVNFPGLTKPQGICSTTTCFG